MSSDARRAGPADGSRGWATLERLLGTRFRDRALLRQALIHRSYVNEHPEEGLESYDRLEYLGDAFLGWVVADELFRRYPGYTEGALSRARAQLVEGHSLAAIARAAGLGPYVSLGQGEEISGGRDRRSTLAGALEALLGATLLDRGPRTARRLVLRWLETQLAALNPEGVAPDAKSAFQEQAQALGGPLPEYRVVDESGPPHARRFRVQLWLDGAMLAEASGGRKVEAEQAAARDALQRFHSAP